ncbi:hypothetical protein CFI00_0010 [Nocardioides sp. S5]|nr:hypothetical protein CFI00_0010 [Nocardioides sp. S5]
MHVEPQSDPPLWTSGKAARHYWVVCGSHLEATGCTLILEHPTHERSSLERSTYAVPSQPDHDEVARLRSTGLHPMSVKLEHDELGTLICSVLFRTRKGPERRTVSPAVAVALCVAGTRTVMIRTAVDLAS